MLPKVYRPLGARMVSAVSAGVFTAVVVFLWLMLPPHVRDQFGWFERFTLLLVFLAILAVLYGVFRTRLTATERGVAVTNGYRRHELYWAEIIAISLTSNRPWALLDLTDGSTVAVMALQTSDGARATRLARELSVLIADRSRTDRND